MEVHRVKAIRFSASSGEEEDVYKEVGEHSPAAAAAEEEEEEEEKRGYEEDTSRNGSQQHLTSKREQPPKATCGVLCGVCCNKAPTTSVWNCDGELLPFTDILCR